VDGVGELFLDPKMSLNEEVRISIWGGVNGALRCVQQYGEYHEHTKFDAAV